MKKPKVAFYVKACGKLGVFVTKGQVFPILTNLKYEATD